MSIWQDWRSFRRFQKLPARDRNIVFYSETHQDWHHLQPLIDFLVERLSRPVCHVTSERAAPLPRTPDAGHVFRIETIFKRIGRNEYVHLTDDINRLPADKCSDAGSGDGHNPFPGFPAYPGIMGRNNTIFCQ